MMSQEGVSLILGLVFLVAGTQGVHCVGSGSPVLLGSSVVITGSTVLFSPEVFRVPEMCNWR